MKSSLILTVFELRARQHRSRRTSCVLPKNPWNASMVILVSLQIQLRDTRGMHKRAWVVELQHRQSGLSREGNASLKWKANPFSRHLNMFQRVLCCAKLCWFFLGSVDCCNVSGCHCVCAGAADGCVSAGLEASRGGDGGERGSRSRLHFGNAL